MIGLKSELNGDEQGQDENEAKSCCPPTSLPTERTERAKIKFCTFKFQAPPVLRRTGTGSTWHLSSPRVCSSTAMSDHTAFSRMRRPAKLQQLNNNEY